MLLSSVAIADKYGVNESSDSGSLPGWVLPAAFIALLIYHLSKVSDLNTKITRDSYTRDEEIGKLRKQISDNQVTEHQISILKKQVKDAKESERSTFENYYSFAGDAYSFADKKMSRDQFEISLNKAMDQFAEDAKND